HARMRAPLQEGDFPFPVKYGYAAAGTVTAGMAEMIGRRVFALAPHQRVHRISAAWARPLPESVPTARAALAANMETALNAVWDAPIAPGQRVAVIGLGLVGLLICSVLGRRADLLLRAVDLVEHRAPIAEAFGAAFVPPGMLQDDHDVVFHCSASAPGLAEGLAALAFEGTLVETSWYGDRPVSVPLGAAFHSRRLRMISSQVGHVAPSRRAAYSHADRLDRAITMLDDPRLDLLITDEVAFEALPERLPALLDSSAEGVATRVIYA
ncbi:MAG: zinc-binding alcohol dehydrogenase, partial [Pseudomonadota bacterium]